jgi:alanine dehydrogenase
MNNIKIAIIKERKKPEDKRVGLTPDQILQIQSKYAHVSFFVESSEHRIISDEEYAKKNIPVVDDVSDCDIFIGIKEVPIETLIPNKTYLFFSHTIKAQHYNRKLLQTILQKNIQLIDYETLTYKNNQRVIGFGKWAGIVGSYNALRTWGKKFNEFDLPPAYELNDYEALKNELLKIKLPPIKIVTTGNGRVAQGIFKVLNFLNIPRKNPREIKKESSEMVYFPLDYNDYYSRKSGLPFKQSHFYRKATSYKSVFNKYTPYADLLINGMYWDEKMPQLFHSIETLSPKFNIKVIADITCDIEGSVPITTEATYPENPVIGWDRVNQKKCEPFSENSIDIMAVTNLPTELPLNASQDFGETLMNDIFPCLLEGFSNPMIYRATITTSEGKLNEPYAYLQRFVDEDE